MKSFRPKWSCQYDRIHLIDIYGPAFVAVTGQVTLSVAVYASRRTMRAPWTGVFQMPVCTVLPCQAIARQPTLTESKRPITFPSDDHRVRM